MNIKCLLGKHDWEEVVCLTDTYIVDNLLESEFREFVTRTIKARRRVEEYTIPSHPLDRRLSKYVCLRKDCCAIKDNIKKFLDYWRQESKKEIEEDNKAKKRNREAKKKFNECLKEKE